MMKFVIVFLLAIAVIQAESDPGKPNVVVTKHHRHHHHHHHHSHPVKTDPINNVSKQDGSVPGAQEESQPKPQSEVGPQPGFDVLQVSDSVPGRNTKPDFNPENVPQSDLGKESQPEPDSSQQNPESEPPQEDPEPEQENPESEPPQEDQEPQQENQESEQQQPEPERYQNSEQNSDSERESEQSEQPESEQPESEQHKTSQSEQPGARPGPPNNHGAKPHGQESQPGAAGAETIDSDTATLLADWTARLGRVEHEFEDRGESTEFSKRLQDAERLFWGRMRNPSEPASDLQSEMQCSSATGQNTSIFGRIRTRVSLILGTIGKRLTDGLRWVWERFADKVNVPVEFARRIRKNLKTLENRVLGYLGLEPESEDSSGPDQEKEPGQNTGIDPRSLSVRSFLRSILTRWSRIYHRIVKHFQHKFNGLDRRIESVEGKLVDRFNQVRGKIADRFKFIGDFAERVEEQLKNLENGFLSYFGLEPESEQRSGENQGEEPGEGTNPGQNTNSTQGVIQRSLLGNPITSFFRGILSRWSRIYQRIVEHFQHKFNGLPHRFETVVDRFRNEYDSRRGLADNFRRFWKIFKHELQSLLPSGLADRLESVGETLEQQLRRFEETFGGKLQYPRELAGRFASNLKNLENTLLVFLGLESRGDQRSLSANNDNGSFLQRISSRWSRIYHRIVELLRNQFSGWSTKLGNGLNAFRSRFDFSRGLVYNWEILSAILKHELNPSGLRERFQGFLQNFKETFNSQGGLAEQMTGFGQYLERKLNFPREWANTLGGYIVELRNDIKEFLDSNDKVGEFRSILKRRWTAIQGWPGQITGNLQRLRYQLSSRTGVFEKLRGFVEYLQNEFHLPVEWARTLLEHLGNLENGIKNFFGRGSGIQDLRTFFTQKFTIFRDKLQELVGILILANGKYREIIDKVALGGDFLSFWRDLKKSFFGTVSDIFEFFKGIRNTVIGEIVAIIEDGLSIFRSAVNTVKAIPNKKINRLVSTISNRKKTSLVD